MPFFPVENRREQPAQCLFLTAFGPFSPSGAEANAATRRRRGDRKPSVAVRAKTWGFHVTTAALRWDARSVQREETG